jgi:hypothetical protein
MNLILAGWQGPAGDSGQGRWRVAIPLCGRLTIFRSHCSQAGADDAPEPPDSLPDPADDGR